MEGSIVVVLDIRKDLIPCAWILGVVHVQDMHNHPINDLCFSISISLEGNGFGDLGIQQRPKDKPNYA
jgi:hypothetical protein